MVKTTYIHRRMGTPDHVQEGLALYSSADDDPTDGPLAETKSKVKQIQRRGNYKSDMEFGKDGPYTLYYIIHDDIVYMCICEASFQKSLAFSYLRKIEQKFTSEYSREEIHNCKRAFAFLGFDNHMQNIKSTFSNTRDNQNLDKLNVELRNVTQVMTKNIEELLTRGDSLDRMGQVSSRLLDDSKKYRKAAVRINWELLLKQYGPLGGLGLFIVLFLWWRFF